jgi:hypothetical protein
MEKEEEEGRIVSSLTKFNLIAWIKLPIISYVLSLNIVKCLLRNRWLQLTPAGVDALGRIQYLIQIFAFFCANVIFELTRTSLFMRLQSLNRM